MDLYLKIMKTVSCKIKSSGRIENLKNLINEKEGINEKNQFLFFNGNLLTDDQKLSECGIQRNSTVHLIVQSYVLITVRVKKPNNKGIITLEARACDTIRSIKSMIQAKEGILSDEFTLVYGGCLLEDDDRTLASLNIKDNSTMHLISGQEKLLSIFVQAEGKKIQVSVKAMFTVGDTKAIIESTIGGLYRTNLALYYVGKELEDSKTLAFYDIKEGSLLELFPTYMIFVKIFTGETKTLNVRETDTVEDIKTNVFNKMLIPIHLQNYVFAGKQLKDDRNLASYGIQRNSTLQMVPVAPSSRFIEMPLIKLDTVSTTNIGSLKSTIQKKIPVKGKVTKVSFKGTILKDGDTLADYKIGEEDKVVVFFE